MFTVLDDWQQVAISSRPPQGRDLRSMTLAETHLPIYDDTAGGMRRVSASMSGNQPGDPAKGVQVMLAAVDDDNAPQRLPLGPDAHRNIQAKLDSVAADMAAWADRSTQTNFDSMEPTK